MQATYGRRDSARGKAATVAWLAEELGELSQAVRKGSPEQQLHELGDVLAWLASLANQLGLSLEEAAKRYEQGCPSCHQMPCVLPHERPEASGPNCAPVHQGLGNLHGIKSGPFAQVVTRYEQGQAPPVRL